MKIGTEVSSLIKRLRSEAKNIQSAIDALERCRGALKPAQEAASTSKPSKKSVSTMTAAAGIRRVLEESDRKVLSLNDIATGLRAKGYYRVSRSAIYQAMSELTRTGATERLRRGFYRNASNGVVVQ